MLLSAITAVGQEETVVTVGYGETFETIATKYGVTVSDLLAANPGKAHCYAGQKIVVPHAVSSPVGHSGVYSPLIVESDSLLVLAKAKSSVGEYKEAIKIYNNVINLRVRRAYGFAGRGECYYNLKKYKKAQSDLGRAILTGQLATLEKDWCEEALEDIENEIREKRERRSRVWGQIGLAVASAAAMAATTYAAAEQSRAQNAYMRSQMPVGPAYYPGMGSNDIIAQSQARTNQIMAQGNAQLQQMTQATLLKVEQDRQHIFDTFQEQLNWSFEFNAKNGRYPTDAERDMWLYNNHRDLWMLEMQAKANGYSGSSDAGQEQTADEYKGELSPEQYRASYQRWEAMVEGWMNNLTIGGYTTTSKDGDIRGKVDNDTKGYAYTGNQMGMKNAQKEMRRIRLEAEKYGVHIPQSKWETATARY